MSASISRNEVLSILGFMGVSYPPTTKQKSEVLAEKLLKALDFAQRLSSPESIDLSALKTWKASSNQPLIDPFKRTSLDESAHIWFREQTTGNRNVPLYTDAFADIRQTLMSLANSFGGFPKRIIFLVQDVAESYSITLRVIEAYALNESTPLLAVLYEHGNGSGPARNPDFFLDRPEAATTPKITATLLEQKLFINLLDLNSMRIPSTCNPPRHPSEKGHKLSFILPLCPLSMIDIGMLTSSGCAVCGMQAINRCAQCHSTTYCGKECQKAGWREHKALCKALSGGTWQAASLSRLQVGDSVTHSITLNKTTVLSDPSSQRINDSSQGPPPNVYNNYPFIIKIQVPLNDFAGNSGVLVYDRARSVEGHLTGKANPDVYTRIEEMVRQRGINGMKAYRWARRVGDWTLSICLDAEPQDSIQW